MCGLVDVLTANYQAHPVDFDIPLFSAGGIRKYDKNSIYSYICIDIYINILDSDFPTKNHVAISLSDMFNMSIIDLVDGNPSGGPGTIIDYPNR